ncbi:NRDE family protein [Xanthomonas sp. AM6]|uniref:NRDE family protein n=1 Tax=Xanthomonas sp. AM6 TaxID=2982531 RepID=UPI0021DB2BED|nr:NRDE family protein [Xanthomonas sp. AM6]UYB51628.1 NRDE family protein [Xanthomonas sp. AM6]
MCLVALALESHPRWRLLLVGNRDEFHARPTAPLQRWAAPAQRVLAGRDLRSGGSWVGLDDAGRCTVVTNVRDPLASMSGASRGALVADYLAGAAPAAAFADALALRADAYPPFNLLLADADGAQYLGNHPLARQHLAPGIHGMSNGALDAPWPKTARLCEAVADWIAAGDEDPAPLWRALVDETVADDAQLPDTGVGLELERRLSPAFIRGHDYGTRASTIVAVDESGRGWIHERRFGANGVFLGETRLEGLRTGDSGPGKSNSKSET